MATGDTANENNELKRVITSGATNYNQWYNKRQGMTAKKNKCFRDGFRFQNEAKDQSHS